MIFDGDFTEPWGPGETRESRFCFIGKNLDRDQVLRRAAPPPLLSLPAGQGEVGPESLLAVAVQETCPSRRRRVPAGCGHTTCRVWRTCSLWLCNTECSPCCGSPVACSVFKTQSAPQPALPNPLHLRPQVAPAILAPNDSECGPVGSLQVGP
jgi:hypothetical protein